MADKETIDKIIHLKGEFNVVDYDDYGYKSSIQVTKLCGDEVYLISAKVSIGNHKFSNALYAVIKSLHINRFLNGMTTIEESDGHKKPIGLTREMAAYLKDILNIL